MAEQITPRIAILASGPLPLTEDTFGVAASAIALEAYRRGEITQSHHTIHVVAQGVDRGPKVAEHPVPIYDTDTPETLNERTQLVEKATIAYAIDSFVRRREQFYRDNP